MKNVVRLVRPYVSALVVVAVASCSQPPPPPPPAPPPVAPPVAAPPPSPAPEPTPVKQPAVKTDPPFIIADLGFDDALAPIARFTGQHWVNTWPHSDEAKVPVPLLAEIPDFWLGQPVPREWQLWQAGKVRTVTVIGARRGERKKTAGCMTPAVLDLEKPPGSKPYFYGASGLAVTTGQVLDEFRTVDQHGDEWQALGDEFMQALLDAEQRAWADEDGGPLAGYLTAKKQTLTDVPLVLLVTQPIDPNNATSQTFFFEMSRTVNEMSRTVKTKSIAGFKLSGWVRRTSSATGWQTEQVVASSVSNEGALSLSPLVRMRHSGRDFWLMFVDGIKSGGFAVYEVTADKIIRLLPVAQTGC